LPVATPATYTWDFGDGTQGTGATTTHIYRTPGSYVALVTVTNSTGTAYVSTAVTVVPPLKTQVDFVGSSGGGVPTVAIVGSLAYVGEGNQLTILDIGNPAAPRRLGGYSASDRVQDIEVAGSRAYMTIDMGGLHILDISNPAAPRRLGGYDTPGRAYDVQVVGNRAYVADGPGSGLKILDVGNPAAPTLLGSFHMDAYDLQVVNDRAYVTSLFEGLYILNVADPASPKLVLQEYEFDTPAVGIQIVGNLAYVTSGNAGLRILNLGNSGSNQYPVEIGRNDQLGKVKDLHVVENRAYVVNYDGTLHILDVSTPSSPQLLSSYDTPGDSWDVRIAGGRAYVADGDGGLLILNVSNARHPAKLGAYATWSAYNVKIAATRAYIASEPTGLQIVDISNPAHPQQLGGLGITGLTTDVDVAGDRAYITHKGIWNGSSYVGGGLSIADIADPAHPTLLGSFSIEFAIAVQVVGAHAYVAAGDGLHILNIGTPTAISEQGALPGLIVWELQVVDNRAYLAAKATVDSGLAIVDVSVPSAPKLLGSDLTMADAHAVKVVGKLAYVLGRGELRVLDVSVAQHPIRRGSYPTHSLADMFGLDVVGSLAYLVGQYLEDGSLTVVDVAKLTTDTSLKALYEQDQSSLLRAIQKVGNLAYIAAEEGGLQVLRIRTDFDGPVPTRITSAGGRLSNYDGRVALEVPALATTEPLTITYTGLFAPSQSLDSVRAVQSFKLEAHNANGQAVTHLAKPYKLVVQYDDAELTALGIDEENVSLAFWTGSAWVKVLPCAGCGVDKVNNRLTATIAHFIEFALLDAAALTHTGLAKVFLPIVRR
jgi:hypothetical protein